MAWLSPPALLAACWCLTFTAAAAALGHPGYFDLVPVFMNREALDPGAFAGLGLAWVLLALLVLLTGDLACRWALRPPAPFHAGLDLDRAASAVFWINLILLAVTAAWIATAAAKAGGLTALAMLAALDSLTARDLLLEYKLFTGMRLAYAALPATGCVAAALLATRRMSAPVRSKCRLLLAVNCSALILLPIVMSQRLLLLQFLLSAYLAACLVRGRLFGLPWLLLSGMAFLAVWTLREGLTNPHFQRSAFDLSLQKLAFYFVNDLWNSFAPLQSDIPLTLGLMTFGGLMVLTGTDGLFGAAAHTRLQAIETVRGGGEFSLLTAPLVDFGPWGAALFLFAVGFLFRLCFHLGRESLLGAAIYSQIGAALLFSSHGLYATHQNLLFSLLVIAGICRLARPAAAPRNRPQQPSRRARPVQARELAHA